MNSPSKREIRYAIEDNSIEDPYDTTEDLDVMVAAYKEVIDVLRDVLASTPYNIDERIDYYTIQVDKPDWNRAKEIIDKYPEEPNGR